MDAYDSAGLSIAAEAGGGLYWWPVALLVLLFSSLTSAWVLLVEIQR